VRALLVLNRSSRLGSRDGALVRSALESAGVVCERESTSEHVDVVIAAGGDGTVISTLPLAISRGVPLGILPLGTFNDLAHTLGIPPHVPDAIEAIVGGQTRQIDLGRVNGTYFVNEASVGISTRIARKQTPELKQRLGIFAVISTTLQSLRGARRFFVELAYDGNVERFRTIQMTIANSDHFGGIIERPGAAIDDGCLDLYSIEPENWLQALVVARKIVLRDPNSGEGLRTRRSARFAVSTHRPHHIAADGEPAGKTPAVFEVLPKAVRILVPRNHAQP
jgi:diacylglycerol kinase (ATP)